MQNLSLDDLIIHDFHPDISEVKKVFRRGSQTATLAFDNVYLNTGELIKLNKYPVRQAEWLQVANIIFMQTTNKFEFYDVSREIKTSIDLPEGFSCCSWNPSQTVLAVLYNDGSVQLLAIDFIKNHLISLEKCNASCDIQVSTNDSKDNVIVWNKEGDSFLVGYSKNGKTAFNVYTDKCQLFAKGECDDLDLIPVFAWNSDGCLIGALEQNQGKLFIRIFENNGLKKDLLAIPHQDIEMEKCSFEWNTSGELFALLFVSKAGKSRLWLYSHDNYHWQVKQSLHLNNESIESFDWLPSDRNTHSIRLVTSTNELVYKFSWKVNNANGYLAVIDGHNLSLIHIDNQMKPSPLSTITHQYPMMINEVRFSPKGEYMVVVLCDNTIYVTELKNGKLHKLKLEDFVTKVEIPLCLNNCAVDDNMNLYMVHNSKENHWVYCISKLDSGVYNTKIITVHESNCRIAQLLATENHLIVKTKEEVIIYDIISFDPVETRPYTLQTQVTATKVNNLFHIFTLNENYFYCDDNVIMENVTSYLICESYVMLTTTNDMLFCFYLNNNDQVRNRTQQNAPLFERLIPKAATLICYLPYNSSIVLQLERGDLEIIKPRILSVRLVKKLLSEKQFATAFNIVKYDRLNTDVLVDLDYDILMSNTEKFIESFEQNDFLNVFITGLQNENVVDRLYKNCITVPVKKVENKKHNVLKKLIETMEKTDRTKYLSSIIIARVMLNQYEELICDLKWALNQNTINVDSVFNTVIPLINPEILLNAALSLQEFDMVQWVANKTQMDPLEYMPFINKLADLEPNYRSYKINMHLKRYDKAFESLIKCENDILNEILHLIDTFDLTRFAIRKTRPDNKWYQQILEKCAGILESKNIYTEAGLLYKKINMYEKSLDCFVNGASYDEFINLTNWMKYKGIKIVLRHYYEGLVKKLIETGKIKQAADVYELLDNYEEGILLLINNKLWSDAMEFISKYNRFDFIVSDFQPAITMYANELCQQFMQKWDLFDKYCSRLDVIRTDKLNMLTLNGTRDISSGINSLGFNETEDVRNADVESLLSVLSVTTKTAISTSSSVTRKKKKLVRKTTEIREGGVFENIALIRQLHVIATELYGYANIVNQTCHSLLSLNDSSAIDSTSKLHSTYADCLAQIGRHIDKIWPEDFINPPRPLSAQAAVLRLNIEHLEPQFRFPPEAPSNDWVIYSLT